MKLDQAVSLITRVLARMDKDFRMPLFDEWTVLEAGSRVERILHYSGSRSATLQQQFERDIQPLVDELYAGQYAPGHFFFSREGEGALYDAFMCLGPRLYAVFNNTTRTMAELSADPIWRQVQGQFVDLSERFRADTLRQG